MAKRTRPRGSENLPAVPARRSSQLGDEDPPSFPAFENVSSGVAPAARSWGRSMIGLLPILATGNYAEAMSGEGSTAAGLLRDLRKKQGRSLRAAASDLGLAASHLSRLERGERNLTEDMSQRVAGYYGVSAELVMMTEGRVPEDVVAILRRHPELIDQIRDRYSVEDSEDSGLGSSK